MVQRVRTGCKTCRKRRVKCDEKKPICVRCKNGNFVCEGFDEPQRKPTTSSQTVSLISRGSPSRSYSASSSSSDRDSGSPCPDLSWRHHDWQREQLPLYHHFVTTSVTRLFRADHVGFWRDQVAQMSFEVDIVYKSLLAIGAVHRASLLSCQPGSSQEAAKFRVLGYAAYGCVLGMLPELIEREGEADRLALLVTLMLLTYFECFAESHKGAFRHLWAAIQLLRKMELHMDLNQLSNMAPIYDAIIRLDFLAQKLVPFARSSFLRCSDLAIMETPFWNRRELTFPGDNVTDMIAAERYRLMQLVGSHNKLSRVVWGCWCPVDERPTRAELMGYYEEMKLWRSNSPATFACCLWDVDIDIAAAGYDAMEALPIPPPPLHFTSPEAAINVAMYNAYLGCALAMISSTDEDPIERELHAFNLVYETMCITRGLTERHGGQYTGSYKPCDTLGMGISLFLYYGARRSYSSLWQNWTIEALRAIGREGLSNGATLANSLEIMFRLENSIRGSILGEGQYYQRGAPLGAIRDRLVPLVMPLGDAGQPLSYFLRYGGALPDGDERMVQVVAKGTWEQDDSGAMTSLELDIYDESAGVGSLPLLYKPDAIGLFATWRGSVESGWHGCL